MKHGKRGLFLLVLLFPLTLALTGWLPVLDAQNLPGEVSSSENDRAAEQQNDRSGHEANTNGIAWTGVDRALKLAAEQEKLVLIDVYAEWCPYCQRMQSEVWPDEKVEELVGRHFVPVRINTESEDPVNYLGNSFTEASFASALRNQGVPTVYFMNAEGEIVGKQPGFLPADLFSKLLGFVGTGAYKTESFEEYENRNP